MYQPVPTQKCYCDLGCGKVAVSQALDERAGQYGEGLAMTPVCVLVSMIFYSQMPDPSHVAHRGDCDGHGNSSYMVYNTLMKP